MALYLLLCVLNCLLLFESLGASAVDLNIHSQHKAQIQTLLRKSKKAHGCINLHRWASLPVKKDDTAVYLSNFISHAPSPIAEGVPSL